MTFSISTVQGSGTRRLSTAHSYERATGWTERTSDLGLS
jgi:hypothetical protein